MTKYQIGDATPIYVSTFSFKGHTFYIHRPVLDKREGWQVSLGGVPLQLMAVDLKAKAIRDFTRECEKLDDFEQLLKDCLVMNRKEYNL